MSPETLDPVVALLRDWGVPSDILRFGGRLHPMLVHFPVALLVVGALLEFFRRGGKDRPAKGAFACVVLGALIGLGAGLAGWLNAELEPHSRALAETLDDHRWFGVGVLAASTLALLCGLVGRAGLGGATMLYRAFLLIAALLVMPTGHLGGSLVFGKDYLFEVLDAGDDAEEAVAADASEVDPDVETTDAAAAEGDAGAEDDGAAAPAVVAAAEPDLWRDTIQPLLAERCVECHGPTKKKGGLRLDRLTDALDPDLGVIAAGDAEGSILIERVVLDADDPDLMPPEGGPLTPAQIEALRKWIDAGAPHGPPPTDDDESASVVPPPSAPVELDDAHRARLAALVEAGAHAMQRGADSTDVEVSFALLREAAGDAQLAELAGLEAVLTELRLDRTAVTDAGLAGLRGFDRLERLDLSRTGVGDAAIAELAGHPGLEVLNLYGTKVTDAGVARLADLPKLERVFLWNSGATAEAVAALRDARPGLFVEFGDLAAALVPEPEPADPGATAAAPKPAPCCAKAIAAGNECDHPCCVEARGQGLVCAKCGGG